MLSHCLYLKEIAESFKKSLPGSIVHTAVAMPKIDLVREMIDRHCDKQEDLVSVDYIIIMSDSVESFHKTLRKTFDISKIERI